MWRWWKICTNSFVIVYLFDWK